MRIRILDRILVALAGVLLVAACAGLIGQVFFGKDVIGFMERLVLPETTTGRIIVGICAGVMLIIGLYCLLMLFRHRRRKDKFILQKLESGELAISLKTLETMVQKCVDQHKEIKTEGIRLENQRDGLLIRIRGMVAGGISIPLTVDTLQKQVKQYVTACSGVEVKGIRIQIESSGAEAEDAPFAIEPPTGNRLPKGNEETVKEPAETAVKEEKEEVPPAEEPDSAAEENFASSEEAAAAAAMAAAENMMSDLQIETEDDRPIHQRLFSTQEEPCIMPLPPENLADDEREKEEAPAEIKEAAEDESLPDSAADDRKETKGDEES